MSSVTCLILPVTKGLQSDAESLVRQMCSFIFCRDTALVSFRTGQMSPVRHPGGAEDLPSVSITIATGAASAKSGDSNTFQDTAPSLCAVLRCFPGGVPCAWQDQVLWGCERHDHGLTRCPFAVLSFFTFLQGRTVWSLKDGIGRFERTSAFLFAVNRLIG